MIVVPAPRSLIEGVERAVEEILGITALRHRSAVNKISLLNGSMLVESIHRTIAANYERGGASANKDRSRQNWRWQTLNTKISIRNLSPEIVFERAIAGACERLGRTDWANQVPVASGLIADARDGRRAIDLVRRRGERHFELIELKIASDTPLYAAIEIIAYGCLWLIAHNDKPARESALLNADHIDLRVLAPPKFYARFALKDLEAALDIGARAIARRSGVLLTFAFHQLEEWPQSETVPDDETLLNELDRATSVTAGLPPGSLDPLPTSAIGPSRNGLL